ncbi:hypothetical protein PanWU01x14_287250 [Parasponia andersonii]|uniref:Uncharacterized protein n=1 Tax=Parasponia andersonii TaxID=3476 RepID=A0A2P5AYY7_PARAD|nr:hypothetical protein PanWU01x14_287250 [Parasponia andersonii]
MAEKIASGLDQKAADLELLLSGLEERIRELKIEERRRESEAAEPSETATVSEAEPSATDDQDHIVKMNEKFAKEIDEEDIKNLPMYEKEADDLRKRIDDFKKEVKGVKRKLFVYGPKAEEEEEEEEEEEDSSNYEQRLRKFLNHWKVIAFENRKAGKKTLTELVRQIDRSDDEEGGIVFDSMRTLAVDSGTQLSRRIVDYFLLFTDSEAREIAARTRAVLKTIRCIGLEKENSTVTRMFVSLIETVDGGIKDTKGTTSVVTESLDDVWYSPRENRLLGSIFYKILFMEIALCCPCFAQVLEYEELMLLWGVVRETFNEKMNQLSLEINELKETETEASEDEDSKRHELRKIFDTKIREMWDGFVLDSGDE